jgi:hypothetical protein
LVVKFPDPDPAKRSGSDRIRNTDGSKGCIKAMKAAHVHNGGKVAGKHVCR